MEQLWNWQVLGGPVGVALLALFFAAGLILVALWTALPIAVFGVRSILRDLLETQRETNRHLDALRRSLDLLARGREPQSSAAPPAQQQEPGG